jgi:hypothetical protein
MTSFKNTSKIRFSIARGIFEGNRYIGHLVKWLLTQKQVFETTRHEID